MPRYISVIEVHLEKKKHPPVKIAVYGLDWWEVWDANRGKLREIMNSRGLGDYTPSSLLSREIGPVQPLPRTRRKPMADTPPAPHPVPEPWLPPQPDPVKRARRVRKAPQAPA